MEFDTGIKTIIEGANRNYKMDFWRNKVSSYNRRIPIEPNVIAIPLFAGVAIY